MDVQALRDELKIDEMSEDLIRLTLQYIRSEWPESHASSLYYAKTEVYNNSEWRILYDPTYGGGHFYGVRQIDGHDVAYIEFTGSHWHHAVEYVKQIMADAEKDE